MAIWQPARDVLEAALAWRRSGREYDEASFLYLLSVERARASRSNHPLRLLLATVEPVPGKPVVIAPAVGRRLFAGLRTTLRDTDVVGWYRQDRVAGALLIERDASGSDLSSVIQPRVDAALRQRLQSSVNGSLRLRIVQLQTRIADERSAKV